MTVKRCIPARKEPGKSTHYDWQSLVQIRVISWSWATMLVQRYLQPWYSQVSAGAETSGRQTHRGASGWVHPSLIWVLWMPLSQGCSLSTNNGCLLSTGESSLGWLTGKDNQTCWGRHNKYTYKLSPLSTWLQPSTPGSWPELTFNICTAYYYTALLSRLLMYHSRNDY